MEQYELVSDRRFGDEVFEAGVDFESAGAFLLGLDVGQLCTTGEAKIVADLTAVLQDDNHPAQVQWGRRIIDEHAVEESQKRSKAFVAGFVLGRG